MRIRRSGAGAGTQPLPRERPGGGAVPRPTGTTGSPAALPALQRSAGNAAVRSLLGGSAARSSVPALLPVQRAPAGPLPLPAKPTLTEEQYATWRRRHPKHEPRVGGTWEPDHLYRRYTAAWFTAQGYTFGLRLGPFGNVDIDVWIDDRGAGREFRVIRWTDGPGGAAGTGPDGGGQGTAPPKLSEREKGTDLPISIDPNADYDRMFGPPVGRKENIDAAFGEGNMVLHEDGSLVLYLNDGGQYVFRPVPGGRYVVYDPKGKRLSQVYTLPPSDVPDVDD
ncbi:hypothetical protein [Nakamurella sp.]|uniref:hypothetical protein n=1 Tax=Nakamurella sp. TaxID=1869182 RepID=UPI003782FD21